MPKRPLVPALLAATALTLGLLSAVGPSAAADPEGDPEEAAARGADCPQLQLKERWYGDNAERIQRVIDRRGRCGWEDGEPPAQRPYAVFDWDNTMIKNDISDQTLFWMIGHDRILQPPKKDWRTTSQYMTDAGAKALRRACGPLAEPGEPLPTRSREPRSVRCADELLSVRTEETTTDGAKVFAGYHHRRMQGMYAWVGQLLQGYTPEQVRRLAGRARTAALEAPVGATQRVGSSRETAWIRYYPEMRDLVRTLRAAGIQTWIVSASPKEFADVWGSTVGIGPRRTLGVFQLTTNGLLNGRLEGCGGVPDRADSIMTYVDGKRCFINERIVGITGRRALRPAPYAQRPVITGGDATTDVSMLSDATGARIVLNRNGDEVMCRAYDNPDGRWLVQPMFIQPLPQREGRYPCSTTGALDPDGDEVPVRRPDGTVVPDQRDTVYGGR